MVELRIIDIVDEQTFAMIPPCQDPTFDHRSCDYWEDAERGSKTARASWLGARPAGPPTPSRPPISDNPFAPPPRAPESNPFAVGLLARDDNPFVAPRPQMSDAEPAVHLPRKLALLIRGAGLFGSYAKVLREADRSIAWTQFGPLSAYPRAARLRELYPSLPASPLPAVISCIASAPDATGRGHARRLVEAACEDLAARGFSAVEAYPDLTLPETASSAARPAFWHTAGFQTAVDDERFPVMRREL